MKRNEKVLERLSRPGGTRVVRLGAVCACVEHYHFWLAGSECPLRIYRRNSAFDC